MSNAEDISGMFQFATEFNADLSSWDIGASCTTTSNMFWHAESFNQALDGWDISNVRTIWGMFAGCREFNQDLSSWKTSNVMDMQSVFGTSNLKGGEKESIAAFF